MTSFLAAMGPRGRRALDGLVIFWVSLWVVLGVLTAYETRQLTSVADAAEASAVAADRAGEALQSFASLPVVGDDAGELGDGVREASDRVRIDAAESRVTVARLAVLLGISIALIPVTPVLWIYLPARMAYRADVTALRRRLAVTGRDDALTAYLAHRAVDRMPYRAVFAVSDDPAGDVRSGRHEALARAELERLGLTA